MFFFKDRIVGIRQITLADATRMLDVTDSYMKVGKHPVVPFFDDAPLIETPYRYMLFSVYDGQHNGLSWCRFGRVAVVYDRIKVGKCFLFLAHFFKSQDKSGKNFFLMVYTKLGPKIVSFSTLPSLYRL